MSRSRTLSIAVLIVLVAQVCWVYRDTVMAMINIMTVSDTYSHIFLAPIAAIWLAWGKRASAPSAPAGFADGGLVLGGLALAGAGAGWLIAQAAGVSVGGQFMLIAMICAAVLMVWGLPAFKFFLFPLGFLFLTVPFGDNFEASMMQFTADITVWLLRLSGIAVYRDGLHFQLPTGRWSVVEACSGLRYLLATLPLAVLFAYLSLRRFINQVLFVFFALGLSVVANWIRAYLIVLIGHHSGMTLAVGVDHLIYGWVFFGLVIAALFWFGARWSAWEARAMGPAAPANPASATPSAFSWPALASRAALAMALIAVWPLALNGLMAALPKVANLAEFQQRMAPAEVPQPSLFQPSYSGHVASAAGLQAKGSGVEYFAAMYARQHENGEMIAWGNRLVKTQGSDWTEITRTRVDVERDGKRWPVIETELRSIDGRTLLVWSWYKVGETTLVRDWQVKLYSAGRLLTERHDDAYFVAVYALVPGRDRMAAVRLSLQTAAQDLHGRLEGFRPRYAGVTHPAHSLRLGAGPDMPY